MLALSKPNLERIRRLALISTRGKLPYGQRRVSMSPESSIDDDPLASLRNLKIVEREWKGFGRTRKERVKDR